MSSYMNKCLFSTHPQINIIDIENGFDRAVFLDISQCRECALTLLLTGRIENLLLRRCYNNNMTGYRVSKKEEEEKVFTAFLCTIVSNVQIYCMQNEKTYENLKIH